MMDSGMKKDSTFKKAPPTLRKRILRSEDLFENDREVVIIHGEAEYRLQITKAGKLILNK